MKSIGDKIKNTLRLSLIIIILIFTAISIFFVFMQNNSFMDINNEAASELKDFTDIVIDDNVRQYANDLTAACGNIIDANYEKNSSRGDSAAEYLKSLYIRNEYTEIKSFEGVGFINGSSDEKLLELGKIADIRGYIKSIPGYDPENPDILDVFAVTQSGIVLDGTNSVLGDNYKDLRNDSWYVDSYNSKGRVWTDVIVGSVTGDKKIDYVSPVIINNEFKGAVVVSAPISEIYNSLLNINFSGIKDIILTDSKGKVIAGSNEYDIFGASSADEIVFREDYCMSAYNIREAGNKVYFVFDVGELISAARKVERKIQDNEQAIDRLAIKFIVSAVLLYVLLAVIFALLTALYSKKMSSSLVNPILLLCHKVEELGKGNMDIDMEDIKTDDEIGLLADKFEGMSRDLKKYVEETADIAAEKERYETEMSMAANIQLSLMNREFPKSDKFDVFALMRPARSVGGDLYAVQKIDDDNILVSVADVSGKGIPASLFSVRTKVYIQIYGEIGLKPSEILEKVNNRLCQYNNESIFVTAFLGILNINTGRFTYANAGHNRPVLISHKAEWINSQKRLPLGCMEDIIYKDSEIQLKKGDSIFIYSDGVTEAVGANDDFYGDDRLIERLEKEKNIVLSSEDIVNSIYEDVSKFCYDKEQWDDVTMLLIKYTNE